MKMYSTYSVKIKHYNHVFRKTISLYREVVDFLIEVCLNEWDAISIIEGQLNRQQHVEQLCHRTKDNPNPTYLVFDKRFYKLPTYLRRAAITEAIGKVSSYQSNLNNWKNSGDKKGKPSLPKAGFVYPALYRDNMFVQVDTYKAKIKVYVRNTWDWIAVDLRKSDVDYINRHCSTRKQCSPTLQKRGKEWYLDFPFEESVTLNDTSIQNQTIVSVDLGINTAATIAVMTADGTVLGRHFCKLPKEYDSLSHAINRIKKAQQHGARKTPRLWAKAKGINHDISVKTANYIMDVAVLYNADVIVFEHLDTSGKKRGSKKQKLHLWRKNEVQSIVTNKAHHLKIRISRVNAWGTSRLAYDGSGPVLRGEDANQKSYSICQFTNGKLYNCDLNASYNIGARYCIRELIKSLTERKRLAIEAKVPQCTKRSTCTFSTLISLNAVLMSA